jgi:hypothetical protein
LLSRLNRNLGNILGASTKRKLVLFFVDDWGSIRMSSRESFNTLVNAGVKIQDCRYNKFDGIESNSDLEKLFEVLLSHRDRSGNPAIFTAVSCVANPDFEKIKNSNFQQYYFEPFTETLRRYPEHDRVFDLWKEGIRAKVFLPQFHGREHLNVIRWMDDLKENVKTTRLAFDHQVSGIGPSQAKDIRKEYQAAFDVDRESDMALQKKVLKEGLELFEKLLGYQANFFTPPNAWFNHSLDGVLNEKGIKMINVAKVDHEPVGQGRTKKVLHYFGEKNKHGQRYIVRNALFEPNRDAVDWVDKCMNDIEIAFRWRKPAIISSHRVNFIGFLHEKNRDLGLIQLDLLLKKITAKWPDAEFVSTPELAAIFK